MAKLAFKQSKGGTYRFPNFSSSGVSGAGSRSEGVDPDDSSWSKVNEESITDGTIGAINDLNTQITLLTNLMEEQKIKLKNLIIEEQGRLSSSVCTGHVSCSVPGRLSSYVSRDVPVLNGEIALLEASITFLGYLKTYLGFLKANNMYYRIES
jgi:hypothetical protein